MHQRVAHCFIFHELDLVCCVFLQLAGNDTLKAFGTLKKIIKKKERRR